MERQNIEFVGDFGQEKYNVVIANVFGSGAECYYVYIRQGNNYTFLAGFTKTEHFGWSVTVPRPTKKTVTDIVLEAHDISVLISIIEEYK